jgi:hypothetical protein
MLVGLSKRGNLQQEGKSLKEESPQILFLLLINTS